MIGRTLAGLIALIAVAGCTPMSGVVTKASGTSGLQIGSVVPDVQYESMAGKQTSFDKARQAVAVIAFVAPQGAACCSLDPKVINIADRLWDVPVTVAEFSLPTSKCPHGPGCVEACNLRKGRVMSLCDAGRLAWNAYGKPAPGTLVLVGPNNRVVVKASLSDPGAVVDEARKLGQAQIKEQRGPGGGRLDIY
jgi:hypothetical protein